MAHEIASITSFGKMLKYLRQKARMTQRELGTAVGYSYSHIARLERSQRLPDSNVVRMHFVEALGLQAEVAARLVELADAAHRPMQIQASQGHLSSMRLTSLVGRTEEWAKLRACWEAVALGKPQCVVISGEAGVGKTRLAEALIDWVEQQGIATATTRCYAVEGAPAYSPVSAWLRTDSLLKNINTLDPLWRTEVARILPELLTEQPTLVRPSLLTEGWQRQRFLEALVRVVLHGVPIVLFLDDLQWADHESIEWLNLLLHFDGHAQLMLVFTVRSEDAADNPGMVSFLLALRQASELTEVNLGPLSAEETATLAAQVIGQALTTRQADQLFRETEGNPLFAVEILRAGDWNEEAGDGGTDGVASGNLRSLLTLPTVQAVISWRLRKLSPQARELAGLAATVGHEFTLELLAKASGQTQADLLDSLEELIRRRLVNEHDAERRESSYDFSHDKIREAAYMTLSVMRRKLLHFRVAEALEGVDASQLDTTSGQVAAHFDKANLLARALPYYVRAAEASRRIYANVEAIQYYSRSEELLWHLPTSAVMQSGLTLLGIREALGDLLSLNAQYTSARAAYERALAGNIDFEGEVMRARLHRKIADTFQSQGKHDEASCAYKAAESTLGTQQKLTEPVWLEEWVLIQMSRISLAYGQVHTDEMDELLTDVEIAKHQKF